MKKLLNVAWKDLIVTFRDPAALIMMLATPFLLTLAVAFALGGLGGGGTAGVSKIPVIVVNHDSGELGRVIVHVFQAPELADLVQPSTGTDDAAARAAVDANDATAAVIIPANFSEAAHPSGLAQGAGAGSPSIVEVYKNPTRPVSAGVISSIVDQTLSRIAAGAAAGQVAVTQLMLNGIIAPQQAASLGPEIGERAATQASSGALIALTTETGTQTTSAGFDWLAYMAPSMAIMFLMFTVANGGRSILAERDWGTLPRMLTTPSTATQVIGGKVSGIYVTGILQMAILIGASGLLFGVRWGSIAAVVVLTLALVAAATGWGALIAAYSRTASQANQAGTMMALFFGMMAGNFVPRAALPEFLQTAGYVTPNAWGLEGYSALAAGGGMQDVIAPVLALLIMAAVLFALSVVAFRRQYA